MELLLPAELHHPDDFGAWVVRLRETSGVRAVDSAARGWRGMIDDSKRLEVPASAATRAACPLCNSGHEGMRVGEEHDEGCAHEFVGGGAASGHPSEGVRACG